MSLMGEAGEVGVVGGEICKSCPAGNDANSMCFTLHLGAVTKYCLRHQDGCCLGGFTY
jgi:hypothetical protein